MQVTQCRQRSEGRVWRDAAGFWLAVLGAVLLLSVTLPARAEVVAEAELTVDAGDIVATYWLGRPVARLGLEVDAKAVRQESWTVETPGVRLDENALVSADGDRFDHVVVRAKATATKPNRQYEPVVVFGDGGRAVYTANFNIDPAQGEMLFRFQPAPGGFVALPGRSATQTLTRSAASFGENGTFAYFGTRPVDGPLPETEIVDASLPAWIRDEIAAFTPRLLNLYTTRLARAAQRPPFLLVNRDSRNQDSGNGEVLPSVIRFGFAGRAWETRTPQSLGRLRALIAHEVAHFWLVASPDASAGWMHEGGAEQLSWQALVLLGADETEDLRKRNEAAIESCSNTLSGAGIGTQTGGIAPYACGAVVALISDAALRPQASDLFGLWASLLQRKPIGYVPSDYFAALRQRGADPQTVTMLEQFVEQGNGPAEWSAELARHDIALVALPDSETQVSRAFFRGRMADLMGADCKGYYSMTSDDEVILVHGKPDCEVLDHEMTIRAIAGRPLDRITEIYAAMRDGCAAMGRIGLQVDGETDGDPPRIVALPCGTLPPPPQVWHLESLPEPAE